MDVPEHRRERWGDVLCAAALAVVLCAVWAWRDWPSLSALRLPDTDDMMRLQQVRDWIGGQAFADVSQHRLGASPGLAMHWSRLADLVPGGIIAGLSPLVGAHAAELSAVIAWPAMLFAAALALTARIARVLGGAAIARTAAIVAAVAFPATTVFLPGRIDHHGLQIVLLLIVVRALVASPAMRPGLIAGLAAAGSVVIGLETAPVLAAAGVVMAVEWLVAKPGAEERLMGFGIALGAGLLVASVVFRTTAWDYPGCDGFTATAWRAAMVAALAPLVMALAARDIARPATRAVLGAIVVGIIGTGVVLLAPACLSPYGMVDPLLARVWLGKVGEAQALFAAPPSTAIGYAGVMLAGIAASAWQVWRRRDLRWAALLAMQVAALLLTCAQLRGAYVGAMLAAPGLAAVIAVARARGSLWLAGAWVASAGMLYPLAAQALVPVAHGSGPVGPRGSCTDPVALADLAGLPPGRLLAPLDLGAYAIGATKLSVVGAPYHRNNAGNLAVYRFYLGAPASAAHIARTWHVRYVALFPESFAGMAAPGATATLLRNGHPPRWLRRIATRDPGLALYAVVPRLFPVSPAR